MPNNKSNVVKELRHNEYYGIQTIFDNLYNDSRNGKEFTDLIEIILSEKNILLAYKNMKGNGGSKTPGTDGLNIVDISKMQPEEIVAKVRYILLRSQGGYKPKLVRRKEIPKPNGKTRPLGIPCIWDRLIQQCIKQVLEPICEAKFSNNSYGFRPIRSVEHAIAKTYRLIQLSKLYHVIEFDIKGFFDNVDHSILIRQMWNMGIRDKKLIWIIKQILKAPILLENGKIIHPQKGTPQGGIISPLLANIVLNDLDRWIESQWENNPVVPKYTRIDNRGWVNKSHGYRAMREMTNLKEMWIVRYADDFRIFCRHHEDAIIIKEATTKWLQQRLRLAISQEKTKIVDLRKEYMDFLGFKIKVVWRGNKNKYVICSHIADKALEQKTEKLVNQMKRVCEHVNKPNELKQIKLYNSMVIGIQNYYRYATHVAHDLNDIQNRTYHILYNRTNTQKGRNLSKTGRELTKEEKKRFGNYKSMRYITSSAKEPIYPIYAIKHKNPIALNSKACIYTPEGREIVHRYLEYDLPLLNEITNTKQFNYSTKLYDNRISLYSGQKGKCYITGIMFDDINDIHCHHKIPSSNGGSDEYSNLVLVHEKIHKLIHAKKPETILKYLKYFELNSTQLRKVNYLRFLLKLDGIKEYNIKNNTIILEKMVDYLDI